MSAFSDNLRRIRFERRMTQEEFAAMLGTTKQNISRYESGAVSPLVTTAQDIADRLGVTLSELNGDRQSVLVDRNEATLMSVKRIPILGDIAAGAPITVNREYDEYIDVPSDGRRFDAALRVTGDSMLPRYRIGDLALIRYQDAVDDGQIAAVVIDDEATLKRVYHTQAGIMLCSDNPEYKPIVLDDFDCQVTHIIGRAVGVLRWED